MLKKISIFFLVLGSLNSNAQILGGGVLFSNAVTFNQSWISGCPAGGTQFSNQVAFEPTTTIDPCAPAPSCAAGTTGSDVWFSFFAQSTTATIVVNPSASFNVAIQAFSGSACPGLTAIGCVDAGGNNVGETLNLTGLTFNTRYYFRIFGAATSAAARTGTYTFCGSAGLGSTTLPVEISSFNAVVKNSKVILNWTTESEYNNAYFEIEKSINGNEYEAIGRIVGKGTTSQTVHYSFTDPAPLSMINYYRLKQVDIDNRYKYSAVVTIKLDGKLEKSINIFPNPVSDKINFRISSDISAKGFINITDALGQSIYRRNESFVRGDNVFALNSLKNLPKGVYTLQVVFDKEILFTKFISAR